MLKRCLTVLSSKRQFTVTVNMIIIKNRGLDIKGSSFKDTLKKMDVSNCFETENNGYPTAKIIFSL